MGPWQDSRQHTFKYRILRPIHGMYSNYYSTKNQCFCQIHFWEHGKSLPKTTRDILFCICGYGGNAVYTGYIPAGLRVFAYVRMRVHTSRPRPWQSHSSQALCQCRPLTRWLFDYFNIGTGLGSFVGLHHIVVARATTLHGSAIRPWAVWAQLAQVSISDFVYWLDENWCFRQLDFFVRSIFRTQGP